MCIVCAIQCWCKLMLNKCSSSAINTFFLKVNVKDSIKNKENAAVKWNSIAEKHNPLGKKKRGGETVWILARPISFTCSDPMFGGRRCRHGRARRWRKPASRLSFAYLPIALINSAHLIRANWPIKEGRPRCLIQSSLSGVEEAHGVQGTSTVFIDLVCGSVPLGKYVLLCARGGVCSDMKRNWEKDKKKEVTGQILKAID